MTVIIAKVSWGIINKVGIKFWLHLTFLSQPSSAVLLRALAVTVYDLGLFQQHTDSQKPMDMASYSKRYYKVWCLCKKFWTLYCSTTYTVLPHFLDYKIHFFFIFQNFWNWFLSYNWKSQKHSQNFSPVTCHIVWYTSWCSWLSHYATSPGLRVRFLMGHWNGCTMALA